MTGSPKDLGLIGVGMDCTSGRTFSAKSRRLFSAFSLGIPPYIMWITTFSMLMVCCIVLIFSIIWSGVPIG